MQYRMGKDSWWDWRVEGSNRDEERREMSEDERKNVFENLAERCVLLDNLAPNVTPHTVRTALGQFGTVLGVKRIMNPGDMKFVGAAIAEMGTKEQRDQVVQQLREYLFMVGAIPRPARAIPVTPLLLIDHPLRRNPNKVSPRLMKKTDPGAEYMYERERQQRLKADDDTLLQQFMEKEERKLATTQQSTCQEAMEKLKMIAREQKAGTIREVKRLHGMGY